MVVTFTSRFSEIELGEMISGGDCGGASSGIDVGGSRPLGCCRIGNV